MRLYNKILFILVGIVLIAFSIYQISLWFDIPGISEWSRSVNSNQDWLLYLWLIVMLVIGVVGLIILILGLFRPRTHNQLTLTSSEGRLEIPKRVLEKDLQYQLATEYRLVDPAVNIRLLRNHKAKVNLKAAINPGNQNMDQLSKSINQFMEEYLKERLELKIVKPVTRIYPVDRSRQVKVV